MKPQNRFANKKGKRRIKDPADLIKILTKRTPPIFVEISPGVRVPDWVAKEATYDKDGCMKEEWWDR